MSKNQESEKVVGATVKAIATVLVGGSAAAQNALYAFDESIIVDWYIGDGERAEAGDVVCKLVGPEHALKLGASDMLNCLHQASTGDGPEPHYQLRNQIDWTRTD